MARVRTTSLLDDIKNGDFVTIETVKRVGTPLLNHVFAQDLSVPIGSSPDRPEGVLMSPDMCDDNLDDAFKLQATLVRAYINDILSYVKVTRRAVIATDGDPDEDEDAKPLVVIKVHPNFNRHIYACFAAHEQRMRGRLTKPLVRIEHAIGILTGATERLEADVAATRRMMEDDVLPSLRDQGL